MYLSNFFKLGRLGFGRMVDDGTWFIANQERPLVLDVHRTVVGDVDVSCDFRIVQNAAKIDCLLLKLQIGEVDLTTESYVVLWRKWRCYDGSYWRPTTLKYVFIKYWSSSSSKVLQWLYNSQNHVGNFCHCHLHQICFHWRWFNWMNSFFLFFYLQKKIHKQKS